MFGLVGPVDGHADVVRLLGRELRELRANLVQVQAGDPTREFPALRTAGAASGNLAVPASSLAGRRRELGQVADALERFRLVTLTGVGGVGKTRLALEKADRIADRFPDGVWVVELGSVTDPDAVPDAVCSVLDVVRQGDASAIESIVAAIADRLMLVVLDNCEHLLDAVADFVDHLLSAGGAARVVATSREALEIDGEYTFRVPSLGVDDGGGHADAALVAE